MGCGLVVRRGHHSGGSGSEETYVSGESDAEDKDAGFSSHSEGEEDRRQQELAEPLTLDVIHAATISRSSLMKYIDEPFLKQMVEGSFVRVVTSKPKPGVKEIMYSMAQIVDVVSCAIPYRVDDTRLSTALLLRIGNSKPRQFTLKLVSNQKPTQKEFDRWRIILTTKLRCDVPTAAWCRRRAEEMVSVRKNYRYSFTDVKALASKRSQDLRKLGSISALKAKLEQRVQLLQEKVKEMQEKDGAVDEEFEKRLKTDAARLEALEAEEQRRLLAASKDDTVKTSGIINKKAFNFNKTVTEEVHKRELAASGVEFQFSNPFLRRPCAPTVLWSVKRRDGALGPNPVAAPEVATKATTPVAKTDDEELMGLEPGAKPFVRPTAAHHFTDDIVVSTADGVQAIIGGFDGPSAGAGAGAGAGVRAGAGVKAGSSQGPASSSGPGASGNKDGAGGSSGAGDGSGKKRISFKDYKGKT